MPIYPFECSDHRCAFIFERIVPIHARTDPQPCPRCAGPTERIYLPSRVRADACNIDPVVVHRNADGSYYFPGRTDAQVKPGRERVELRSIRQIEAFEREVNAQHAQLIGQRVEQEQSRYERVQSERRARLRHAIQHGFTMKTDDGKTVTFGPFSAAGRAFAEHAIARGNAFRVRAYDPGFRVDILHDTASNRDPWRDVDTGWRPVRK